MSIIIVGLGEDADLKNGSALDGDQEPLVHSTTGEKCTRDIV